MRYLVSSFMVLLLVSLAFSAEAVLPEEILKAFYKNDLAAIQNAVKSDPSVVQMKNADGQTLLLLASSYGKFDIVKFLLESGADIEAKDKMGRTPLITAARERGGIDVIKLLVEKGATVNAVDDSGDSALSLAAWRGFEDIVDYLLEKGANVPVNDNQGRWILGEAADKSLVKLFNTMTAKGADLGVKLEDNATLLHMACGGGSLQIIDTLLKSNIDINLKDDNGWTPMHYAAFKGKNEAIDLLLKKGADINALNMMGESPLNIASAWGAQETVDFLKAKGADVSPAKFPKLSGEYMGMTTPGDKPEPFGKGIIIGHFRPHSSIAFSPDGKEAFWALSIPPRGKGYGSGALMHSKMIGDTWTYPVPIRFQKTGIDMDVPFFSNDSSKLYFLSMAAVSADGKSGKERIWFSERQGDSWMEPKPFNEKVNSYPIHWQFSFDKQGNLYFAQWRKMYFAQFSNGEYKEPVELSKFLGKDKLEGDTPFIDPDGSYLIYAASGPGKPTLDLVIMFKKKDGTWTDPVEMGNGINTSGHDLCPIVTHDGKYLFYSSGFRYKWLKTDFIEQLRSQYVKE